MAILGIEKSPSIFGGARNSLKGDFLAHDSFGFSLLTNASLGSPFFLKGSYCGGWGTTLAHPGEVHTLFSLTGKIYDLTDG